jgi:hypothetical protein
VQPGQHLSGRLAVQPHEVLVLPLDEQRLPRRHPPLADPERKVPGALMATRRAVDAIRIGSHAEVSDVEYPVKLKGKRSLDGGHVRIELIKRSVNVAGGTEDHESMAS